MIRIDKLKFISSSSIGLGDTLHAFTYLRYAVRSLLVAQNAMRVTFKVLRIARLEYAFAFFCLLLRTQIVGDGVPRSN